MRRRKLPYNLLGHNRDYSANYSKIAGATYAKKAPTM